MSFQTDKVFVAALRTNETLTGMLAAGDVYNSGIDMPDEDEDSIDLPYIIVYNGGGQEVGVSKDNSYRGSEREVLISIEIAAATRPDLATLCDLVYETVTDYFETYYGDTSEDVYSLIPNHFDFSFMPIEKDNFKPCVWTVLQFRCNVNI